MSDNPTPDEKSVDRRADTVVTEQPGYSSTKQVTRDAAAEQRQRVFQIDWIVWTILGILEILLGLRFFLKLIAANPNAGFSVFIYGITNIFNAPFNALLGTPTLGNSSFEINTLIAMAVYALLFWIIVRLIHIGGNRASARTETTSTREQTPPKQPGQ
jgi:YggT family protein